MTLFSLALPDRPQAHVRWWGAVDQTLSLAQPGTPTPDQAHAQLAQRLERAWRSTLAQASGAWLAAEQAAPAARSRLGSEGLAHYVLAATPRRARAVGQMLSAQLGAGHEPARAPKAAVAAQARWRLPTG